jgi:PAS domain S-box-containing protein
MAYDTRPADGLDEHAVLSLLVEHSADLLARHAPDGTYLYVSPASRRLLGFEPDELVGRDPYGFLHPDDVGSVRALHERLLGGDDEATLTFRWLRKDGHYAWFESRTRVVRSAGTDRALEILSSSRDVSARHRAQGRFERSFADAPIGMGLTGLDGRFLQVNDALCELLGRSCDELMGLTFAQLSHPADLAAEAALSQQIRAGEIEGYSLEKRFLAAGGSEVWALVRVSLVRDEDGQPLHTIEQVVDLTEHRRIEEELRRTNVGLQRFAEVASHDLRSPLGTVRSLLESVLSRSGDALEDEVRLLLERAIAQSGVLAGTLDALLTLALAGNRPLQLAPVPLDEVVAEASEALASQLTAVAASLRIGDLPRIWGDRNLIRILIQNLLGNAIKHRVRDRTLEIEVSATRSEVGVWEVVVEDNGRGFAAEDRERIFELFGRTAEGAKLEGAGIGLATCRRIAERHGGSIDAEPLTPGARFVVTLPGEPGG